MCFPRVRTISFIAVLLLAGSDVHAAVAVDGPTLTMNPNGLTPLAGRIDLTTDVPVQVTLTVSDGTEQWAVRFPGFRAVHSLPLLGLKPASEYTIEVVLADEAGNPTTLSPRLSAATDPLPPDFPQVSVFLKDSSRMEPGFTLLDKTRRVGSAGLYTMIVDHDGTVRWYSTAGGHDGMRQLPNGRLLLLDSSEQDLFGERFVPRTLQVPGMFLHHDMYPMPNGNFLSLTIEKVVVADYPTSETDPSAPRKTQEIYSDAVVEFLPDGTLLQQWHLTDMIDPRRLGYDAAKPGFPLFDLPDWSHSNAVWYDPRDNSILVSIRHQDAVLKFSRATGRLIWILGPHDNWGPEFQPYLLQPAGTPFEWQYHQHGVKVTPHGTVLLFDNGNYRTSPFDGRPPVPDAQNYSRAVEYAIDEQTMQVRQVWEYGGDLEWPMFTSSQGDADWLPKTGNVLLTMTDTRFMNGVSSSYWGLGFSHTAIIEVDHTTPARKLLDMRVYDTNPAAAVWAYRSERIPSLYAADVQVFSDSDGDRVLDHLDNCTLVGNGDQLDVDGDGYGNLCDADLNNDGIVDGLDHVEMGESWGSSDPYADIDGDGLVTWPDVLILMEYFYQAPGPSGRVRSAPGPAPQ